MSAFGKGTILTNKTPGENFNTIHHDRVVNLRSVTCPDCDAAVGAACTSSTGKVSFHRSRRRMALRAEETYPLADVTYARSLSQHQRFVVRKESGLSVEALADLLDLKVNTIRIWEGARRTNPGGAEGARYGQWLREQIEVAA